MRVNETPLPDTLLKCEGPEQVAEYWHTIVEASITYRPETESGYCLHLNTRRRVTGHHLIASGTLDTLLIHPREVFRLAILRNASAVVLAHNHPSGDATPSEADIKVTRDLIRAGQLLKIEVLDHIIIGQPCQASPRGFVSLRELGYFYS